MAGDYISREAALEDFESCNAENPNWTPQRVKTLLLRQPTADVAEVVQGQWEEYLIPHILCCSNCDWGIDPLDKSPYCPHCGAEMSEVK